jgi:TolA-binding protein
MIVAGVLGLAVVVAGAAFVLSRPKTGPAAVAVDVVPAQTPASAQTPAPAQTPGPAQTPAPALGVAPTPAPAPAPTPEPVAPASPPAAAAVPTAKAARPASAAAATGTAPAAGSETSRSAAAAARKVDPAVEDLRVARAKFDAALYDQALADLKELVARNPTSPTAPAAYLLLASTYEHQNRPDEASAAYVELRTKYPTSPAAAEGTFAMAELVLRSKRPDREQMARDLFGEVATKYADRPMAARALSRKAALEERAKLRVVDPELKTSVPAALLSYRSLVEHYPTAEFAQSSLAKLADMYEDLKRYDLAAKTLDTLAERFPNDPRDPAWRAAELYDKKVKDAATARTAYARVPATSSHYKEAQKRAARN